jgi:hypothetical protein
MGCILKKPRDEKTAGTQEHLGILITGEEKKNKTGGLGSSGLKGNFFFVSDWTRGVSKCGKAEAELSVWGGDEPVCMEG